MCDRSNSSSDSDYDEKKNKVNKRSSSSVASVTSATYPAKKRNHGISSHLITIDFKIRSSRIGLKLILKTGLWSDARYVTLVSRI